MNRNTLVPLAVRWCIMVSLQLQAAETKQGDHVGDRVLHMVAL